jgi:hypothetical protein
MAPPFRWFDAFVDRGHPRHLVRDSLALILAVGRHVDGKTLRANVASERLCDEAGLSRAGFFRARGDLLDRGLLRIAKLHGRRYYVLVSPPPDPPKSLTHETRQSHSRDSRVSRLRLRSRRNPRQSGHSAPRQQKIRTQLKEKIRGALARSLAERLGVVPEGLLLDEVVQAGHLVASAPALLEEQGRLLSRAFQASGMMVSESQIREVLRDAAAILDPMTEAAVAMFNGEIVAVLPNATPVEAC